MPTLNEVEEKIEARYAKAKAASELSEASVESRVLEVEQATANVEAQGGCRELRAELGLEAVTRGAAATTDRGRHAGLTACPGRNLRPSGRLVRSRRVSVYCPTAPLAR